MQTTTQSSTISLPSTDDIWSGQQLIKQLQAKAESVLDPLIPPASSIALLDYPNNPNVGDSLIWLGEIAYLKSRNIKLDYVCDTRNYCHKELAETLGKNSIILIHGGGNFGTLWPEEQQFRLRVLRDFPGQPIIQFSQSIHFADPLVLEETAQAIRAHGNYTLLARDKPSFDFASEHFECKVILCPDMAFFIGSIKSRPNPPFDRFILARTDHETSGNWIEQLPNLQQGLRVDASDWLQASRYERFIGRIERHTARLRRIVDPRNKVLFLLWNHLAKQRLIRGQHLLERGRVIIADRLHVHILALLLDKPHAVIDNTTRKISSLHQTWTRPYQGVAFVTDLKEAFRAAENFDSRVRQDA